MNPNYDWINNRSSSSSSSTTGGTSDKVSYKEGTYDSSYSSDNLNLSNIGPGMGYHYMPSTGDVKILVVPIEIKGESFESKYGSKWKETINNGFFGDSSDTGWESVASFYKKSSYGKLNITGTVTDKVTLTQTKSEFQKSFDSSNENNKTYTDEVMVSVLNSLETDEDFDFSEYDANNDGYIDAIWFIYSTEYDSSSKCFWAYTTWANVDGNVNGVKPSCYAWASYKFLQEQDYRPGSAYTYEKYSDAHTYIHETGHMMGLDDYYSYDYEYSVSNKNGNADTPVGANDMMDFNIGDHMAFSKYELGWITPTVVTKELISTNNTLNLQSLTESGKAYLIPIYKDGSTDYNGTPFDEYLLVEYYTPTNLNQADSKKGYGLSRQKMYTKPGVLVYHVNARIGKIVATRNSGTIWDGTCYDKLPKYGSDSSWGSSYAYTFIYSNTSSYSWDQSLKETGYNYYRGRLVSLLPANGVKIQGSKTGYASDRCLYTAGSKFDSTVYSSFKFDDGSTPAMGFKVLSTTDSDCSIQFGDF